MVCAAPNRHHFYVKFNFSIEYSVRTEWIMNDFMRNAAEKMYNLKKRENPGFFHHPQLHDFLPREQRKCHKLNRIFSCIHSFSFVRTIRYGFFYSIIFFSSVFFYASDDQSYMPEYYFNFVLFISFSPSLFVCWLRWLWSDQWVRELCVGRSALHCFISCCLLFSESSSPNNFAYGFETLRIFVNRIICTGPAGDSMRSHSKRNELISPCGRTISAGEGPTRPEQEKNHLSNSNFTKKSWNLFN